MTRTLVEKAKNILEGLEYGYFDLGKEWYPENYDDYYLYFSDPDFEIRKYSLLVFTAGLGNWYHKSAHIFVTTERLKELKNNKIFNQDTVYHFEDYIKSFLENSEAIKQEFPELYRIIVQYLIELDKRNRFEDIFCSADKQLFIELRQVLHDDASFGEEFKYQSIQILLKKLGLPHFPVPEDH